MHPGPRDLEELRRAGDANPPWLVDLVRPEIGGGRLQPAHLAAIDERPGAVALRVSGLDQATFERLVSSYGARFTAIELWKCPRIADLTPLEDLAGLRMLSIYWNQRSPRLWDLTRTPQLTALRFEDLTKLHRLDDLRGGRALEELVFGDAVWGTSTFETLEPLAGLGRLQSLRFHPKRIDDGSVQPIGGLSRLRRLSIPTNLFTTEQIAWLRARLPEAVECPALAGVVPLSRPLARAGKTLDVLLVGKRKPYLNSQLDAERISRHLRDFDRMVSAFRDDPRLQPG